MNVALAGTCTPVGLGTTTVMPGMDFETYSDAGYTYDPTLEKWIPLNTSGKPGLPAIGAPAYSEHPSTEVLSLAYDLKQGHGSKLWLPGMPPPQDLFDHIANGGLVEAWNCLFEYYIWTNVCIPRMGWPKLPFTQLRDAMAKARSFSLPSKLEEAAIAIDAEHKKLKSGAALLNKFSKPRKPTKHDKRLRIRPEEEPLNAAKLYTYNLGDIDAEFDVSDKCPDLSPDELELWILDQQINIRGMYIDREALQNCMLIVEQALAKYTAELVHITGGACNTANELAKLKDWIGRRGIAMPDMTADQVTFAIENWQLPPDVRRVLEIRQNLGSASVKKLFALFRRLSLDGRLRDMLAFYAAHTGRWGGRGPQPQNLPASGPKVYRCPCGRHYGAHRKVCPHCNREASTEPREWGLEAVQDALAVISSGVLARVEDCYGDALPLVSACLRALFSAAPGHDLICSDYSAIEAVVLAVLAGEEWRVEVFRTHGQIYEMSASKITGIPFEDFIEYKRVNGEHHPLRKKIGKVAELASQYQGWVGAWKQFKAEEHFNSDDEIEVAVRKWRADNPMIVDFWKGLEDTVRLAIQTPGMWFHFRSISYGVLDDVLYCKLPSGRTLKYHAPRLTPGVRYGKSCLNISHMGHNSDSTKGPIGWLRRDTYGGRLTENVVQAVSRDILAFALKNLERAGYSIVLHVHDEPVSEVPEGFGSVEEFEAIASVMPPWAHDWPIKVSGGWRGKQYRKD